MSPQLVVADIEHSIAFYTKQLGFAIDFRFEDFYAGISKDGFTIHLKLGKPSVEERENRRTNKHLDLVFAVDGIESYYEEIVNSNIPIFQPLRSRPYGKEFYITDPDGYIIAFLTEA